MQEVYLKQVLQTMRDSASCSSPNDWKLWNGKDTKIVRSCKTCSCCRKSFPLEGSKTYVLNIICFDNLTRLPAYFIVR